MISEYLSTRTLTSKRGPVATALVCLLSATLFAACDDDGDGGGNADTGGSDTGGTDTGGGGGDTGVGGTDTGGSGDALAQLNNGVPCGQILDCYQICEGDQTCVDECYESGYAPGQALMDALDACYVANECDGLTCLQDQCPDEYQACEEDVPPGGFACFSEGLYEVCDANSGYCEERVAQGAAWGDSEVAAGFWADYDCTDFMLALVIINNISGISSSGVTRDCAVFRCETNQ